MSPHSYSALLAAQAFSGIGKSRVSGGGSDSDWSCRPNFTRRTTAGNLKYLKLRMMHEAAFMKLQTLKLASESRSNRAPPPDWSPPSWPCCARARGRTSLLNPILASIYLAEPFCLVLESRLYWGACKGNQLRLAVPLLLDLAVRVLLASFMATDATSACSQQAED